MKVGHLRRVIPRKDRYFIYSPKSLIYQNLYRVGKRSDFMQSFRNFVKVTPGRKFSSRAEAESKEKHCVLDPMPEFTIASPYVHSRVNSNKFTMGNPMPESTLTLCQSRLYPPSQGVWICPLDLVSLLLADVIRPELIERVWRWHIRHNQTVRQAVEYCTCISVERRDDR
jgi:hypothetical protein